MTAIAGVFHFDDRPGAEQRCARMLAAQQIYGLHDVSDWSNGSCALGRRLMRLLPEDDFDTQPLIGADGRYVLVADMRLDNRDEIASTLAIPRSRLAQMSDASVLLEAIERWRESVLEHIVGDYAFALWDNENRQLTLARDPVGQRPLHYHRGANFFAFASMPKGLHAIPEIPYELDEDKIAETLVLLPEEDSRSFFRGIERVRPGHVATICAGSFATRRHWQPKIAELRLRTPDDYAEALREQLDQAVRCRLRGLGNVGVYLSGGLDSGAVAATAARLLANSNRRLIAFTGVPRVGYDGPAHQNRIIDEGALAAQTAALYPNMEHVIVPNIGYSPLADLERWFYVYDRPAGAVSGSAWSHSMDMAMRKQNVNLTLGGDLGNVTLSFDGIELLPELLRKGHWLHLAREIHALVRRGTMSWRGAAVHTVAPWLPPAAWIWLHKIANRDVPELQKYSAINPTRFSELDSARTGKHDFSFRPRKDSRASRLWVLDRIDPGNSQKGGLGGWQTDHRDPTADIRLFEFCLSVPTDQFLRNGEPRALARRALADRLPKAVLQETRRGVSAADWHEDLAASRADVARELENLETCEAAARAIDLPRLRNLLAKWPKDEWHRDEVVLNYRYALLRAVAVGHFVRRATRSNR